MADWAERFLELAHTVAKWSKDDSTKVGAVITDDRNRIMSVGFNGVPRGVYEANTRVEKLYRTIHAEQNAMAFAERDLRGCNIYITHPPCSQCAAMIVQRGITMVCFDLDFLNHEFKQRWQEDINTAILILHEANIVIIPHSKASHEIL